MVNKKLVDVMETKTTKMTLLKISFLWKGQSPSPIHRRTGLKECSSHWTIALILDNSGGSRVKRNNLVVLSQISIAENEI